MADAEVVRWDALNLARFSHYSTWSTAGEQLVHKPFISRTHGRCSLLTAEACFSRPLPIKDMWEPERETRVPSWAPWITWIFESHGARNRSIFCELGPASTTTRTQHLDSTYPRMSPSPVVVDDTDWAKLSYLGTWYGVRTGNPGVYNGTVFQTRSPGSAQISFVGV